VERMAILPVFPRIQTLQKLFNKHKKYQLKNSSKITLTQYTKQKKENTKTPNSY